jgi:hypothetical protein
VTEIEIRRDLNVDSLAELSPAEASEAEDQGYLAGNRFYRDLRGFGWEDVRRALDLERSLVDRIQAADDPAAAESDFDELRLQFLDPIEELCGLDVGVASAVLAISALGAIPVSSCNGGCFGGPHQARHPYVAFYLPKDRAARALDLAEAADIGLFVDQNGIAQVYGRAIRDLLRFAALASPT